MARVDADSRLSGRGENNRRLAPGAQIALRVATGKGSAGAKVVPGQAKNGL